jgi:hypothetical protein
MDVLKITPPFFYSYQCGSTLLTSYLPVYMYSISLQILFIVVTFIIIILPTTITTVQYPQWLLKLFPGVCWPSRWSNTEIDLMQRPIRLINPHQIISLTMGHVVLLLSFGLCSPVLCCSIALSVCVHLCCWLVLIGRFVCVHIDALAASRSSGPFFPSFPILCSHSHSSRNRSQSQRRPTHAPVESPAPWRELFSHNLQVAGHPDLLLLRDFVELGHGWRPRRMVSCLVGSYRGSGDGHVDLGLGSCPNFCTLAWRSHSPHLLAVPTLLSLGGNCC